MRKFLLAITLFIGLGTILLAQSPHILSQRDQAAVIDSWLEERIQTLLPTLMDRTEIDMWVIISREYNEDPVIKTFLPATWHAARRRTMLVLYKAPG